MTEALAWLFMGFVWYLPVGFALAFIATGFRRSRTLLWLGPLIAAALMVLWMSAAAVLSSR